MKIKWNNEVKFAIKGLVCLGASCIAAIGAMNFMAESQKAHDHFIFEKFVEEYPEKIGVYLSEQCPEAYDKFMAILEEHGKEIGDKLAEFNPKR